MLILLVVILLYESSITVFLGASPTSPLKINCEVPDTFLSGVIRIHTHRGKWGGYKTTNKTRRANAEASFSHLIEHELSALPEARFDLDDLFLLAHHASSHFH